MAKIIFDERFYYSENIIYFNQTINFVKSYFDIETLLFYSTNCSNSTFNNIKIIIDGKIASIDNIRLINLEEISLPEYTIKELDFFNFSKSYKNIINYFCRDDDVIIISIENLDPLALKRADNIFILNHIYKEVNSCFAEFVLENRYVKNILSPTKKEPLPNSDLCKLYKERQDELVYGKNIKELQALYYSIGEEVLKRNSYKVNQHVTSLNLGVYGNIYSYNSSKEIFSSVDIENGAIEIFNHKGIHQDEYTYEGKPQNKQDKKGKHNINV